MNKYSTKQLLQILKNDIHSTVVATVSEDLKPETRTIDIMLADEETIYFITARGKKFYERLISQRYIALSGVKNNVSISIRGEVELAPKKLLEDVFEENPYMKDIYPPHTVDILEVFCIKNGQGEYFDLNERPIYRQTFSIGNIRNSSTEYRINKNCVKCNKCVENCPTSCIETKEIYEINQNKCLHCGICKEVCEFDAVNIINE